MTDGGKGSKPRPLSIDKDVYDQRWDQIFKPKSEVEKHLKKFSDDYQDILSTEDCMIDALQNLQQNEKVAK